MGARADVVIIGAGVVGASVAHHLACLGVRDVLLLDRAAGPGQGSTGRATGGFRAQFDDAVEVRLSLLARDKLRAFGDEVGGDAGYDPAGYLWLASSEAELATLRHGLEVQRREGLAEAHEITPAEAREVNPAVSVDGVVGGAFCPTDGFIRPTGMLAGYLASAERAGARVSWDVDVLGAERGAGGRLDALVTSRGRVEAGVVVNAAGAWAGALGDALGLPVPVTPSRRMVAVTRDAAGLSAHMPMTLFTRDGFHLRVRDGRVLLLRPSATHESPAEAVDDAWLDDVWAVARARVPSLSATELSRADAWSGLYEMSPDGRAIVGRHPACDAFVLANGSSGHGVMHAPALGQIVAELIVHGEARCMDVRALRPSRFAEGDVAPARVRL